MIERLKKQNPKKLLIMLVNFIRMTVLNIVHMGNVNSSQGGIETNLKAQCVYQKECFV